jgi:hypothetical protein
MNKRQWEEFETLEGWKEIKKSILTELSNVRDELEDPMPDMDRDEAREKDIFNKGRAYELRLMSVLPEVLASIEEDDKGEMTKKEEEEADGR